MLNPCGQSLFLGKEDIALIMTPGAERFIGMGIMTGDVQG